MKVDRRQFLECMAWAGTGLVWAVNGGVLSSRTLAEAAETPGTDFTFAQISDTHIGFKGQPNGDPVATMQESIARLNARPHAPAFVIHTGDITHAQKPGAFDIVAENMKTVRTERVFYAPGENDVFLDGGKEYLSRFPGSNGRGWQSFDYKGVHFVGLVNVLTYKAGGIGALGTEQLEWLERDVAALGASTPVVVFTHVPLWAVYPAWGWATADAAEALGYLRRFGSVTVLNGHIHQVLQKVEGNVTFHTAMSTAFPQPAPGEGPSPGPLKIPAEDAHGMLGVREVSYVQGQAPLAVVDARLG
ncbi:MAG TPA: metallophosphoesterase [Methylomirabilota bacterium]|jgi:3',5'-cyclic AMP phosphodiesterase CpdA